MNISRAEQRVLHALAQGGCISRLYDGRGRIAEVLCFTRDGHVLSDCDLAVFNKLLRKRLIESKASSPYRISHAGRRSVRSQLDNR
ncbi:hypothetical protein CO662_21355 [Rhizobium anhuiense]|uniref:UPF0386 protein CO662_21355 n=1 Tax=Rhizobium anhuiense TaxID=1184720 RepID=A0ABX4J6T2_9HYPH|nr:YjhX family toxin [Rhizobium anhuiense]PDS43292.1 hypothetical protein CO668_19570 [Rhizobium anhuiense]PDS50034.1 hypothetical protein CO662_21355 [Rhizobium anhuiense]